MTNAPETVCQPGCVWTHGELTALSQIFWLDLGVEREGRGGKGMERER